MRIFIFKRKSTKYPIIIIPGIFIISRAKVNLYPSDVTSNNRVEALVTHQAFKKIIIFEI